LEAETWRQERLGTSKGEGEAGERLGENLGLETRETGERGWTWRGCEGGGKLGGTRNKRVKEAGREPEESWKRGSDEKQERPDERSWRGTRGKLEERLGRETRETARGKLEERLGRETRETGEGPLGGREYLVVEPGQPWPWLGHVGWPIQLIRM
jgi:hypothetical protein